jgi:hypothetical protein
MLGVGHKPRYYSWKIKNFKILKYVSSLFLIILFKEFFT